MNISIASFSFHGLLAEGKMDIFGYLESVKYRYGLDAADIWNGLITSLEDDYLLKVKQALDERELTLVNYHADGPHLWDDSPEVRDQHRELARKHLRAAAILGAQTVRFDTGGALKPITDEQLDVISQLYREYAQYAGDHGFKVGPENHWGLSLLADNMEKIAQAVDHPAYGILLHIGHWEDGDEEGGDRRAARLAVHTHVDARTTREYLESRMKLLVENGYRGCWGVEHHSGKNEYAEVAYQIAEVRRVLSRWQLDHVYQSENSSINPLLGI